MDVKGDYERKGTCICAPFDTFTSHTHSPENRTKIHSKMWPLSSYVRTPMYWVMGDVLWKMSAAGEMRPLWRCPGCGVVCVVSPGGAQGLCQLACAGQGFSFDNGGASSDTSHWWIGWEEEDILNFMKINVDQMSGPFTRWFMVSFTLDNWEQYRRFVGGFLVFVERFIILLPS